MTLNDPLSNALSHILNCERQGKKTCIISPASSMIKSVLELMKKHNYINDFKIIESSRGSMIEVVLANRINKCNAIKPRFSIQKGEFEKFERRYLPAKDFGIIIISTSNGLMVHNDAKANGLGGKLIAYIY